MAQKWQITSFISRRAEVNSRVQAATSRALEICGGKAETYAKQLCPVDTGNLRNSITHRQTDANTEVIGTAVSYAPPVELGHVQQVGRYVPAIGKRLVTPFVAGKPFIRPAAENHAAEYKAVMENELRKVALAATIADSLSED